MLDAMRLYEQAIRSARANGFVHNEALAYELAARFYAARGFDKIARCSICGTPATATCVGEPTARCGNSTSCIRTSGRKSRRPAPTSTIGAPVEHLDLATVIKVSQAVSGEIVLEKLIDTLMRTAIEQAGAERGLLILRAGTEPRIEAEATTSGDTVVVQLRDEPVTAAVLPESVLHYVLRTRESVILDDAAAQPAFAADPYIRQRQARSILCLPLINQAKLIGVLYLENNLTPRVFTPARIAVLKLLASQAAISLENTRLYRDLAEREAKIRRLVDANIIGIFIWDLEGRILEANDAFLRMVGYDREDLVSGRLRWTDLTPPEWRDRDARGRGELKTTGTVQPYEKEYFRKDGSRVPVLIGAATFDERRDQGVAFVLDLTERKRAEAEARESERRYREVQMELAHANRVATMGQLTASIAHEVNQPIAAAVTNAAAALRWLARQPPDLEEVRQALDRIVKDGNRAGDVIGRIRALIKKAPPRKDRLDINEAIREVIELTRGEAVKNGVSVQTATRGGLAAHPRRSGPAATSDPQPDHQRRRGHERVERRAARVADHHRPSRIGRRARRGAGFGSGPGARRVSSASSTPSTRRSPVVWAWGCRSAVRSSKRMADGCGRAPTCPAAPFSVHDAHPRGQSIVIWALRPLFADICQPACRGATASVGRELHV